jgi:uncharacterized spore protein YtfJ
MQAHSQAEAAPSPGELAGLSGDQLLAVLAERVGAHADARMVYGDPIERDGITIVPVATVRWGFGIGSGYRGAPMRTGGGGATATPTGYLEITGGRCRYVPLHAGSRRSGALAAAAAMLTRRLLRRQAPPHAREAADAKP